MIEHLKIILLHFEQIIEHRARSFVWFLLALINPLILIMFWRGANKDSLSGQITVSELTIYYFFLIIAVTFLMSHIEEDVAYYDIKQGNLVRYLLRPISYYWIKFYEELPYRVLQGFYGLIILAIFFSFFGNFASPLLTPLIFILSILIAIFAYFISFTFKMIVGLLAFWFVEIGGLFNMMEVIIVVFAGLIMPISLMPQQIKNLANYLPFSYIVYYPIFAFLGKFAAPRLVEIVLTQLLWLLILITVYKVLWIKGIKKFTGVGN